MHVGASLYRLDDATDFAAILCHALANAKVLQRQLVTQRNRLFGTRFEARVVSEVFSNTIRAWLQVDYGDTYIVGDIVHEKMNHPSSLPAEQHIRLLHVAQRYMLRF
jgi:hypothetical protein